MNIYFIVEGFRTEKYVYKRWVKLVRPNLNYVDTVHQITQDNYSIISGDGYPQYLDRIIDGLTDVKNHGNIDSVFICIDSEDKSYNDKFNEIQQYINDNGDFTMVNYHIIVQHHCIESWFLGNRTLLTRTISNPRIEDYRNHFDVNINDPEQMTTPDRRSIGTYSKNYMSGLSSNNGLVYSARAPSIVCTSNYYQELINRNNDTNHIPSFIIYHNLIL